MSYDRGSSREAVWGLVRALGFTATEFQSAAEFLKSSHLLQTACLIADMRMPGMTGLELYRHLIAVGTPIPTVLVTAYHDQAARARALKAGSRCYLAQPLELEPMSGCIRSAIPRPARGADRAIGRAAGRESVQEDG